FFEHYYAGGFGSVRGFERNSLGPRSTSPERAYTSEFAWDDRDGDGVAQAGETASTFVLCDDPENFNTNRFSCRQGEIINDLSLPLTQVSLTHSRYRAYAGNIIVEAGAEILFPLPFIKYQRMMQSSFFVEGGYVFSSNCSMSQHSCFSPE